jgi:hypothetical protein
MRMVSLESILLVVREEGGWVWLLDLKEGELSRWPESLLHENCMERLA